MDKTVFEEVGDFDIKIKSGQDTDLWIRIGLLYPVVFCWEILALYVYDPKSLSKNIKYNTKKLDFNKFENQEKTNPNLKIFLDLNRYSLAIKCKLNNDTQSFNEYYNSIDKNELSFKKRFLLLLSSNQLKFLIQLNLVLVNLGLSKSIFK